MSIKEWLIIIVPFLFFIWLGGWGMIKRIGRVKVERFVNSDEKSKAWLIGHIEKAKKEVKIVSGNLNPRVYDGEVVNIIKQKLEATPDVEIQILSGPEVLVLNGENKMFTLLQDSGFVEKFKDRFLLDFLKKRPVIHFRVIDGTHLFVEEPHGIGEKNRWVTTVENSYFKGWQYKRTFDMVRQEAERISRSEVTFLSLEE